MKHTYPVPERLLLQSFLQSLIKIVIKMKSFKGATTIQKLGSPNRAKPEKERGRGLGRGLGEPLPRKFLEFWTSNRSIWCIDERKILK